MGPTSCCGRHSTSAALQLLVCARSPLVRMGARHFVLLKLFLRARRSIISHLIQCISSNSTCHVSQFISFNSCQTSQAIHLTHLAVSSHTQRFLSSSHNSSSAASHTHISQLISHTTHISQLISHLTHMSYHSHSSSHTQLISHNSLDSENLSFIQLNSSWQATYLHRNPLSQHCSPHPGVDSCGSSAACAWSVRHFISLTGNLNRDWATLSSFCCVEGRRVVALFRQ